MTPSELLYNALGRPDPDEHIHSQKVYMLSKRLNPDKSPEKQAAVQKQIDKAKAEPHIKRLSKPDTCCICGIHRGTFPAKKILSSGFTNWDIAQARSSEAVCDYCAVAIKTLDLRQSSWLAWPGGIQFFKRGEIAKILFDPKPTPFMIYVTTSWKKLGQLKADINTSNERYIVQFEETKAVVEPGRLWHVWDTMSQLYSIPVEEEEKKNPMSFFTKEEIRTGNYKYSRIAVFGRYQWWDAEHTLRPWRGSPTFNMLVFALNQEKLGRSREDGIKKETAASDAGGKRDDGEGSDLPGVEVDSLGQCRWF